MKLSMKSRYGLRALIDLTINSKTEQVALNSIAERNKISPQYLEQVFASLRKAGIVKSIKGSQGGYFLSRPPQEITVSSIIEALEGDYRIEDEELPKEGKYTGSVKAIQKLVIDRVNDSVTEILQSVTLHDLEKEYQEYIDYGQDMYFILRSNPMSKRKAPKVRFYEWARSERPEKTTKHTVLAGNYWYSILFCGKLF